MVTLYGEEWGRFCEPIVTEELRRKVYRKPGLQTPAYHANTRRLACRAE
jgi:hypothetical protein